MAISHYRYLQAKQTFNSILRSIWENQNPTNVLHVIRHSPTAPTSPNIQEYILVLSRIDVKYVNASLLNYHIFNNTSGHIQEINLISAEYQVQDISPLKMYETVNASKKQIFPEEPIYKKVIKSIVERSSCCWSGCDWEWRYCYSNANVQVCS